MNNKEISIYKKLNETRKKYMASIVICLLSTLLAIVLYVFDVQDILLNGSNVSPDMVSMVESMVSLNKYLGVFAALIMFVLSLHWKDEIKRLDSKLTSIT